MSELDKQIRLRATAEEKQHLETAAADAGYPNLSDYLRHVLFDTKVLIVGDGEHSGFVLVPAWSSEEEERVAAKTNLEGLLQLVAELQAQTSGPTPDPPFLPEASDPVGPGAAPADVGDPSPPTAPPVADAAPEPTSPLAAVPDAPPRPTILGPAPQPDENYGDFLARRTAEIQLGTGATAVRAGFEADAEWRAALGQAGAEPIEPTPEVPQADHGFCGHCGAALSGTAFCSGCGNPAA